MKVEETRFPNTEMLNRLDGLATRLETFEQQRRQLEASQERS
jgi:hypothetical protein